MISEKTCRRCERTLPLKSFPIQPGRTDGRHSYCVECRRAAGREYEAKNKEKRKARNKERHDADPEKFNARFRRYRERHHAELLEKAAQRRKMERVCKTCEQTYIAEKCLSCEAKRMRVYNAANRHTIRAQAVIRYKRHSASVAFMEKKRQGVNETRARLKREVFERLGNKCYCCGLDDPRFLSIEHLNNDGHTYRMARGKRLAGTWLYRWIQKSDYPPDIVLACYNCNMARQHAGKGGLCPHQSDKLSKP